MFRWVAGWLYCVGRDVLFAVPFLCGTALGEDCGLKLGVTDGDGAGLSAGAVPVVVVAAVPLVAVTGAVPVVVAAVPVRPGTGVGVGVGGGVGVGAGLERLTQVWRVPSNPPISFSKASTFSRHLARSGGPNGLSAVFGKKM